MVREKYGRRKGKSITIINSTSISSNISFSINITMMMIIINVIVIIIFIVIIIDVVGIENKKTTCTTSNLHSCGR